MIHRRTETVAASATAYQYASLSQRRVVRNPPGIQWSLPKDSAARSPSWSSTIVAHNLVGTSFN